MAQKKNNTAETTKTPREAQSMNTIAFSGRVCEKGLNISKQGTARFTIAHNMGPKAKPVFNNCVMFPKNGKKAVEIPAELIKKGYPVIAKGYVRNGDREYTPKGAEEAKTFRQIDLVVLELLDNAEKAQA